MSICIENQPLLSFMKPDLDNQLNLLSMQKLPREIFVRQEEMPAKHYFPSHHHSWHQLLYAISGVLVVDLGGERYFIPPEQAIWLPAGCQHSVYTEYGADLKSLYIECHYRLINSDRPAVLHISPLVRELILEASGFSEYYPLSGYENDLVKLLLQSLARLKREDRFLPWPISDDLIRMCNLLYKCPDNTDTTAELAEFITVSVRTLDRRFRRETGMSLKHWRSKLRLMKSIELLNTPRNITSIALELGYSSPSPFIYMFREQLGLTPSQYRKVKRNENESIVSSSDT